MSFLHEKQARHHIIFIFIFFLFMILASFGLSWAHGSSSYNLLLLQKQQLTSSLLEQNVSPQAIARALNSGSVTEEGLSFLEKTGHTKALPLFLSGPVTDSIRNFLIFSLVISAAGGVLLLIVTLHFLSERENLYLNGTRIISEFSRGNFEHHLPSMETGSLYQLFAATDQLAAAFQTKNNAQQKSGEFLKNIISDISHQLKTPVAALKLYMDILLQEPDSPETVTEFAEKSMDSLLRMEQLLQLLLKMMRLDTGSISFDKKYWSADALISNALKDLSVRAKKENKKLIIDTLPQVRLFCDPSWTCEALSNMIKNALDHTISGDTITIRTYTSPGIFRISVSDTGEGIAEDDLPHIFKRFYRSRHGGAQKGFGLGLSLAKSIIEGQGGLIFAESIPDEGTTFTISFLTDW